MSIAINPPQQTYNWGPVKPWVANAGNILGPMFGIKTIGGVRNDPLPDHPSGHALDFMITQPNTQAGVAQGNALANFAVAHYQELGIKYIIWNRNYWDAQQGWIPYTAPSVIAYNPHTDHVHITFNDAPGAWTSSAGAAQLAVAQHPGGPGDQPPASTSGSQSPTDLGPNCAIPLHMPLVVGTLDWCLVSKSGVRHGVGIGLMLLGGGMMIVSIAVIAVFSFGSSNPGLGKVAGTASKWVKGGGSSAKAVAADAGPEV